MADKAAVADGSDDKVKEPVTVVAAIQEKVPIYLTALGTVTAYSTVTVNPQVGGELLSVNFHEGQQVRKGDLLAEIDSRTLRAQYDQVLAIRQQNQSLLSTAQSNYRRANSPEYRQYVAKSDLTNLHNQVAQYTAAVAAAQANIDQGKVQLGYTRITAPINGITGIRGVDAGNVVSTSSQIVTITQVQPIYVTFSLPEQYLDRVRTAKKKSPLPTAALDRNNAHVIDPSGDLQVIDNQISAGNGTFRLRAQFLNADEALWPGQFVNVRLKIGELPDAVVVPSTAIFRGKAGDSVYVMKADNTVTLREVTQGEEVDDSRVVISSGLRVGEKVITEGQFRLSEGTKVNPKLLYRMPPASTSDTQLKPGQQ
nr:efflux RND transporter periplasmic adaptor subunit [Lysobacter silvestris]